MKSKIDFINSNTRTALIKMILPLFMAMVLMIAYNMVDSLWVGNMLGEGGYAALTTAGSISIILNAIAMGISNGAAIVVSQLVGKGNKKDVNSAISTTIIITAAFCLVLVAAMETFLKNILTIFGTPADIYHDAFAYLQIFIIGYFAVFMYMQMTAIFRSFGDSIFQMIGMLAGTVLNAIIDPLFIHFAGIAGAAWATTFSQILCLGLAIVYAKRKAYYKFDLKLINMKLAGSVVKNAVPSCIQQSVPAISSMIMVVLVNRYNVTTIAAYGVIKMIENILFFPAMAMNMGLMTIVGQCVGAGREDRTKDYMKTACVFGSLIELVLTGLVLIFAKVIARAFVNEAAVGELVSHALLIIAVGYICYMITSIFMAKLSGMGKPNLSMILMFVYYIVIRVPLALILMDTRLGLDGMWIAILISHLLATLLGIVMSYLTEKKYAVVCNG